MGSIKKPKQIEITDKQVKLLQASILSSNMTDDDKHLAIDSIACCQWLQRQIKRTKMTIRALRKLLGFKSESSKKSNKKNDNQKDDNKHNDKQSNNKDDAPIGKEQRSNKSAKNEPRWNPNENHGRYSSQDYVGCPVVTVNFSNELLRKGICPECASCNTTAPILREEPDTDVYLVGMPIITGTRVEREKGRCAICKKYFTATLPDEFTGKQKYSPSCITSLAIQHYYGGMPFKRIESLQKLQGTPVADSTQYDLMSQFYYKSVKPIVNVLTQYAANGSSIFFDDSPAKILEQIAINKKSPKNKSAIHMTALLSLYEDHKIYLFNTNKNIAGKEFRKIIKLRTSEASFLTMTDASSHNFFTLEENLMAKWVITLCMIHGRRNFVEILDAEKTDDEILLIIDLIGQIYQHEKKCKIMGLNDNARLAYHQEHSQHVMDALYSWFNNLIMYQMVELNSPFGRAIIYWLRRWEWLTQFLRIPGAPLDNNLCEIAIKVVIRYRKNSLFYKTFQGAEIGDAMMSLIHTAACANANIFHYLNTIQYYADHVQDAPEHWLPWNYQQTMTALVQDAIVYADTG